MKKRLLAAACGVGMTCLSLWAQQANTVASADTLADQQIQEIVVTARLPVVELEPGKTVYHPDASVAQGAGSLYDMLASLPGVTVDANGKVMLHGQAGVRLLMDGKETYLSGEELVNLLRSTPASQADKIEISTQTSARHDAAGSGGMIDIRTRKIRLRGMNLNLNGQYAAGPSGGGQGSISFNLRRDKVNAFLNCAYFQGRSKGNVSINRAYHREGNRMLQESVRLRHNHGYNFRGGMDFYPTAHTTWGVYWSGHVSDEREQAGMEATLLQGGHLSQTRSSIDRDRGRLSAGTSLLHRLHRTGGEISTSFDAFRYTRSEEQLLYTDAPDTLRGDMPGHTHLYITQVDGTFPLQRGWKLYAGGKASYARINNRAAYLSPSPDGWQEDGTRGTHYIYRENIHAVYCQTSYEHSGWKLTMGVRMEHTFRHGGLSGNTVQSDSVFSNGQLHLFPNLTLQYNRPSGTAFQLAYSRRITRPNYGDLNPFVYIFDDYTYESGNTRLRAAFSDRLELVCVYRGWLQTVLFGSHEADVILKGYSERDNQRAYVMPDNQPLYVQTGVRVHATDITPLRRWTLHATALLFYNHFRYHDLNATLTNHRLTPMLTLSNRFALPAGWTAELTASYTGRMAYGQATLRPQGEVNAGLQKKFCSGRGKLSFFVRDLLDTTCQRTSLRISGTRAWFRDEQHRRQVGIGLSWRFHKGENVKEKKHERISEEVKRVNL